MLSAVLLRCKGKMHPNPAYSGVAGWRVYCTGAPLRLPRVLPLRGAVVRGPGQPRQLVRAPRRARPARHRAVELRGQPQPLH